VIDTAGILAALVAHAEGTALFTAVQTWEGRVSPTSGILCAIWPQRLGPAVGVSGLASSSALLTFSIRLYTSTLTQPFDDIDPGMIAAVDTLMNALSGDFDLGDESRYIDLLGAYSPGGMVCEAGYVTSMDGKLMRVMTISVPVVVPDAWAQVAT
jgi:hypothetical protein